MLKRPICAALSALGLFAVTLYPCSIVIVGKGIHRPVAVPELSGIVIGWDWKTIGVIENDRVKPWQQTSLEGATVVVSARTDLEFFQEKDITPDMRKAWREDPRKFIGYVTDYKCGNKMGETKSDSSGSFKIQGLKPGKYCLDVTRLPHEGEQRAAPTRIFLVDVSRAAQRGTLLANVSDEMPDCSGGQSLTLKPSK